MCDLVNHYKLHGVECFFITSYFEDPWVLPNPSILVEENEHAVMSMPFSIQEDFLLGHSNDLNDNDHASSRIEEYNQNTSPMRTFESCLALDSLDMVFPSNKSILEAMTCIEKPWEDMNHRSCFLLKLSRMEDGDLGIIMSKYFDWYASPLMDT
jgi:hypothetical protein